MVQVSVMLWFRDYELGFMVKGVWFRDRCV